MKDIEKVFMDLLLETRKEGGTDIHFVPGENIVQIRIRTKGRLKYLEPISKLIYVRICTHVKFLAHLDVADARFPQSGTFVKMDGGDKITIRASTLPTTHGESLALRLIYRTDTLALENLSIFPSETNQILQMLKQQAGLYIFSGATGSGKTTTMYAVLRALLLEEDLNVITLEDPIEIKLPGITQIQMNMDAGLDYEQGLKAILRHDPDLILVGEIREENTARLAIRAALTGHRVMSTIHAKDTVGTLLRFFEYNVSPAEIEQAIQGVVAQSMHFLHCPLCAGACVNEAHPIHRKSVTCLYEILTDYALNQVFAEIKQGKVEYVLENNLLYQYEKGVTHGYFSKASHEATQKMVSS